MDVTAAWITFRLAAATTIGFASLGGDAGSIGAAGLARLAAGKR